MLELTYEENPADGQIHLNELENCQRECESCFKPYDGLKRKGDDCSGKVVKKVINHTRKHFDIGQVVKRNDSSLKTGEPILVNPNSYNTIKKIISSLKVDLGIGTHRDWVFIGCDGPPYTLASRIIDSDHELDWISLLPGLGHLHMNELKTYFRVVDDIFLHPLGNQVLNFTSSVAYKYFVDAEDTHKAFQALQVLLHGTASEFCSLYILAKGKKNISVNSFLKWASSNENETFNLLFQLIFTFAFAIYAQKIGIRCNDALLTESARLKFMPMFYSFNHPTYQEIEYRDLENRVLYPKVLLQFIRDNTSFTTCERDLDHQGADFCLEGKIKKQKMMAPKGPVSCETWRRISRSVDKVEALQKHVNEMLGRIYKDEYRKVDIYDEICKWRAVLRLSQMINKTEEKGVILNIYDEPLSSDLEDLTSVLNEKMELYWERVASGTAPQNIRQEILKVSERCTLDELEWSEDESLDSE